MPFTFVHLNGRRITDMVDPDAALHGELAMKLVAAMAANKSACGAAAMIRTAAGSIVERFGGSNRDEGLHAEEAILLACNAEWHITDLPIALMWVDIIPCHQDPTDGRDRYPGHRCMDLFGAGRQVQGSAQALKYVPAFGQINCPVFYANKQPPRHESVRAQDWKRGLNNSDRQEVLRSQVAVPEGLIRLGKGQFPPRK